MPYIGNDIRANEDYKTIDDISSSFNGSTTSFALQVGVLPQFLFQSLNHNA